MKLERLRRLIIFTLRGAVLYYCFRAFRFSTKTFTNFDHLFRFFLMKEEEAPMYEIFGAEYGEYHANVNPIFPRISFKKNRAS